jgi:hypothetical protein
MAHEIVYSDGTFRVLIDSELKQKLDHIIQQCYGNRPIRDVLKKLLAHPYLVDDKWAASEHHYRLLCYRRCLKKLEILKSKLTEGTVIQTGIEDKTGQSNLTINKLQNRSMQLTEVNSDWLLIEIERHPKGGSNEVLIQYWLCWPFQREIRLLRYCYNKSKIRQPESKVMVSSGDGQWHDPSSALREDFYRLIADLLGPEWIKRFKKKVQYDELSLLHLPPMKVVEELRTIVDIDIADQATRNLQAREATYARKYGPRQGPPGFGIDHQAGIQLVVTDGTAEQVFHIKPMTQEPDK